MRVLSAIALLLVMTVACGPQTPSGLTMTQSAYTSTTSPGSACLQEQAGSVLSYDNFETAALDILAYLNAGGDTSGLNTNTSLAEIQDLSGDGKYDILMSLLDPASTSTPVRGTVLIFHCQDGQYNLAFDLAPASTDFGEPKIHFIQDLNTDGKVEVVISTSTCGAHSCFEQVQILAWNGTTYQNLLEGTSDDLPYPQVRIRDSGDEVFALEITGTGYGSVGAGPYRVVTRTWTYDPVSGFWKVSGETLETPRYRIHALHDADDAFESGNTTIAEALYLQVINDATLMNWVDPPTEQANLGAYAHFKLIVLYTQTAREAEAEASLNALRAGPTAGNWRDYTELAETYMQAVAIAGLGCPAARDYATNHSEQILAPLGPMVFGYANPDFTPEDICP